MQIMKSKELTIVLQNKMSHGSASAHATPANKAVAEFEPAS